MTDSENDGCVNHDQEAKETNGFPVTFKNIVEERLTFFRSVVHFMQTEKGYQADYPDWEQRLEEFKMPLNIFTTAQLLIDAVLDEPLSAKKERDEAFAYIKENILPFIEKMVDATNMAKQSYSEMVEICEKDEDAEGVENHKQNMAQSDAIIEQLNAGVWDFEAFETLICQSN